MVVLLCNAEAEGREDLARDTVQGGRFELQGAVASPIYAALYVTNADVVPEGVKPKTRYGSYLFLDNAEMELQAAHYDSLPYLTDLFPQQAERNAQVTGGQAQADYVAYRQALLPLELAAFEVDDTLSNLRFFHKYSMEREKYDAIYAEFYPELAEAETEVLAARQDLPALEEGRYYIVDIVGCTVCSEEGEELGVIADVLPAHTDVYVLRSGDKEYMFPAADGVVTEVDVEGGRITVSKKRLGEVMVEQGKA